MKKQFVKPEIKGIRLRSNILAGSSYAGISECGSYTNILKCAEKMNIVKV